MDHLQVLNNLGISADAITDALRRAIENLDWSKASFEDHHHETALESIDTIRKLEVTDHSRQDSTVEAHGQVEFDATVSYQVDTDVAPPDEGYTSASGMGDGRDIFEPGEDTVTRTASFSIVIDENSKSIKVNDIELL
jgi:hypothetical protein